MPQRTKAEAARLEELLRTVDWDEESLAELVRFPGVQGLRFAPGARFPPGALARLATMPGLTGLGFFGSDLSDDDLATVGRLPGLRGLVLDGCPIGDAEVEVLARERPPLTGLSLSRTGITDAALPLIAAAFPGLKHLLELSDTAVTDAGMAHLGSLRGLEVLWLDGTAVTDTGLPALAPAKRLTGFNLQRTAVTQAGHDAHFLAWLAAHEPSVARPLDAAAAQECHAVLSEFYAVWHSKEKSSILLHRFFVPPPEEGGRDHRGRDYRREWFSGGTRRANVRFLRDTQPSRNKLHLYAKEKEGFMHYVVFVFVRTPDGWRIECKRFWTYGRWERDYRF